MRLLLSFLLAGYLALITLSAAAARDDPPLEPHLPTPAVPPPDRRLDALERRLQLEQRRTAALTKRLRSQRHALDARSRELRRLRLRLRWRWQPTVRYALSLASAVSGVPRSELSAVAWCESRHFPFASNGRYKGLFQLGWTPFGGFSPWDPVANALSAALTVRHDGSWRQWACKP